MHWHPLSHATNHPVFTPLDFAALFHSKIFKKSAHVFVAWFTVGFMVGFQMDLTGVWQVGNGWIQSHPNFKWTNQNLSLNSPAFSQQLFWPWFAVGFLKKILPHFHSMILQHDSTDATHEVSSWLTNEFCKHASACCLTKMCWTESNATVVTANISNIGWLMSMGSQLRCCGIQFKECSCKQFAELNSIVWHCSWQNMCDLDWQLWHQT